LCGHMVVEIQHEKLGAKLHTDTFSYVKTRTRTRPCKHEHLWVVNTLRGNMAVEKKHRKLCGKLHTDTSTYVTICARRRPCKSKVA